MSDKSLQAIQDVVRVPFYQYESGIRSDGFESYFDQKCINLIPEKMQDFDTQTVKQQLTKRTGIHSDGLHNWANGLVGNTSAITIRDFISITAVYDVYVAAVFDNSNSKFYIIQIRPITGTSTLIGAGITGGFSDNIYLTEISQTSGGNLVPGVAINIVKSDLTSSTGYYAVTTAGVFGGVLNTITDTNYPANQTPALIPVGRFINQRGTFYIPTLDGRIWNSYAGQNDINTWGNATSQIGSIRTDMYPDQCLGIARYKNNIVAFSRNSIEFFTEVGSSVNNPSTLQAMDQVFIKFGALKPNLIRNIDDHLYFVAYGEAGQTGLWVLDGYKPVKVSTPFIDSLIQSAAVNLNSYLFNLQSCVMMGKRQIFVNAVVDSCILSNTPSGYFSGLGDVYPINPVTDGHVSSMVYNSDDNTWWGFNYGGTFSIAPYFASSFSSPAQGDLYTQYSLVDGPGSDSSYIYTITDLYQDGRAGGTEYPVVTYAQINPLWFGNEKRKRISKAKVITNTIPQPDGSGANYLMFLLYTKDNLVKGVVFDNVIVRSMVHPPAQGRYLLTNLGMGRVWNLAVLEKSLMNLSLNSLELEIQQGSH